MVSFADPDRHGTAPPEGFERFMRGPAHRAVATCLALILSSCTATPMVIGEPDVRGDATTQVQRFDVEPVVTAPRLRLSGWSPDGQWLAFWSGQAEGLPASAGFVDVLTGEVCLHEDLSARDLWSGSIRWQVAGLVLVDTGPAEEVFSGAPCAKFTPVDPKATLEAGAREWLSPDGRYRADTAITGIEGQLFHMETTILESTTDRVVVTVQWEGSPHFQSDSGWMNDGLFLIGPTVGGGVLDVSIPDGRIGTVDTDFLGLKGEDIGLAWHVSRHSDPATGQFHLLVERYDDNAKTPLLLYHSELDLVEELSFLRAPSFGVASHGSSFSPDGRWLFLSDPATEDVGPETNYWVRPVDPPDAAATKLAVGMGFGGISGRMDRIAFLDNGEVAVLSFPKGQVLSRWSAEGYYLDSLDWWSPDSERLAAVGFPTSGDSEAIFVLQP